MMIKKYARHYDNPWIECPKDYRLAVGEKVRLNPKNDSGTFNFGKNNRPKLFEIGTVVKRYDAPWGYPIWHVEWNRQIGEYYYSDLLIDGKKYEELKRKKDLLKIKYKHIDPFEEENWID